MNEHLPILIKLWEEGFISYNTEDEWQFTKPVREYAETVVQNLFDDHFDFIDNDEWEKLWGDLTKYYNNLPLNKALMEEKT